jgi:Na+/H+ antiporter NhaC
MPRAIHPWKAAFISILISGSYAIVGRPLSVTAGFGKITASLESLFVPGHAESLLFFSQVSYRLVGNATFAERMGPGLDSITMTQLLLIAGIIFGGFISAVQLREFRIGVLPPFRQIVSAFSGGVLMAGAHCFSGCTWHLLGGLPVLPCKACFFSRVGPAHIWNACPEGNPGTINQKGVNSMREPLTYGEI